MSDPSFIPPPPPPPPPSFNPSDGATPPGPVTPVENSLRLVACIVEILLITVTCGIGWLIWSAVLWQQSTTPAKKLFKMRVVDVATGAPATMQQMVLRELFGRVALIVGGNVLMTYVLENSNGNVGGLVYLASGILVLVTPMRQGVWDFIAKTTVVRAG